jgi:hypothetical protein
LFVGFARFERGKFRIVGEFGAADHLSQRSPLFIVPDRDGDPEVIAFGAVDVVR